MVVVQQTCPCCRDLENMLLSHFGEEIVKAGIS
ncbi:hypothetical protein A2U01_0098568, partial [Trifolium medium]|nr:hypothetical protein [Trifolium medium]